MAKPNIRYLVICWRESPGYLPAHGARAPSPYLPNVSLRAIQRFRKQVSMVNIFSEEDPTRGMDAEMVRKAVWCCIQEEPTQFLGYTLYDPRAWPEPAICEKISLRIAEPWKPELSEREHEIIDRIKKSGRKCT